MFAYGAPAARSFVSKAGSASQDDESILYCYVECSTARKPSPFGEGGPLAVEEDNFNNS